MNHYRAALQLSPGSDTRESVIDDLSTYFGVDPDECVRRCLHWEEWSVEEWQARPRETREGLANFYHTTVSWSFDCLWYAYLQVEGHAYPVSVAVVKSLPRSRPSMRHLDFGSGVGVTSQLFQRLGYRVDLADISTSLLAFAKFRLDRRCVPAGYIDLNIAELEPDAYDVITALATLVHVPDLAATSRMLHRSLRPGGLLFANFDVRKESPENAWHLYSDDRPLRWVLQRTGFEPVESLDGMVTKYQRVEATGLGHGMRGLRDAIALRSPIRPLYRFARRLARRTLGRP